jgi:hypothetical protein
MVSWGSRRFSGRAGWAVAVAVLAAALAVSVALAVHYHGQVAALQHRLRGAPTAHPGTGVLPTVSSGTVALPRDKTLNGTVTVFAVTSSTGRARVVLSVYITGGNSDTAYTLMAFDCTGATGYQAWAVGATDARGAGFLSGPVWPVVLRHKYWLYLSPSSGRAGPGLVGSFSDGGTFSAAPAGDPACS